MPAELYLIPLLIRISAAVHSAVRRCQYVPKLHCWGSSRDTALWSGSGYHWSQLSFQFTMKIIWKFGHVSTFIWPCIPWRIWVWVLQMKEAGNLLLGLKNTSKPVRNVSLTCIVFVCCQQDLGVILVCHRGNCGGSSMPKHVSLGQERLYCKQQIFRMQTRVSPLVLNYWWNWQECTVLRTFRII